MSLNTSSQSIIVTQQPMRLIMDLDWATRHCPCGAMISGRYASNDKWRSFFQEHYGHTNGMELKIVTDDGARCLVEKPAPKLVELRL